MHAFSPGLTLFRRSRDCLRWFQRAGAMVLALLLGAAPVQASDLAADIKQVSAYNQVAITLSQGYTAVASDIIDLYLLIDDVEAGKRTKTAAQAEQVKILKRAKARHAETNKQYNRLKRPVIQHPRLKQNIHDTDAMLAKISKQSADWLNDAGSLVRRYQQGVTIPASERDDFMARRSVALLENEQMLVNQSLSGLNPRHPNHAYLTAVYLTNESLINIINVLKLDDETIKTEAGIRGWLGTGSRLFNETNAAIQKGRQDTNAMLKAFKQELKTRTHAGGINLKALAKAIETYRPSFDIEEQLAKTLYSAYEAAQQGKSDAELDAFYDRMSAEFEALIDQRMKLQSDRARLLGQVGAG